MGIALVGVGLALFVGSGGLGVMGFLRMARQIMTDDSNSLDEEDSFLKRYYGSFVYMVVGAALSTIGIVLIVTGVGLSLANC
jgi:hypothetical protein